MKTPSSTVFLIQVSWVKNPSIENRTLNRSQFAWEGDQNRYVYPFPLPYKHPDFHLGTTFPPLKPLCFWYSWPLFPGSKNGRMPYACPISIFDGSSDNYWLKGGKLPELVQSRAGLRVCTGISEKASYWDWLKFPGHASWRKLAALFAPLDPA